MTRNAGFTPGSALVSCGLATGSRRAEIVALERRDVNLDEGTIHIRHGKGDKARDATIVGDFGIWALLEWKAIQGEGWQYVFVPVNKGGVIGPDKAISADTYYNAVKEVSKVVGFDFATHDLRRSLLTELSRMGARTRDLQAQAGHAHSSTTEKYIQAADAGARRKTFRTRWG
ncbi:MAG TPA: site-specific integrase [Phototrophicaceae bacterium]|nr:site-specific integrase [Phototrophicaceae bacterium]